MKIVDANIVLRYLLNDNPELSFKAKRILEFEDNILLIEVVAEIVYVLQGVYQVPKSLISESIKSLLSLERLVLSNQKIVLEALELYSENNLDFIDNVLISYHKCQKIGINTFDKKIIKLLDF